MKAIEIMLNINYLNIINNIINMCDQYKFKLLK